MIESLGQPQVFWHSPLGLETLSPRHSLDLIEAGFGVAQPPLSDCPPLAEAGLLCIANVLARRLPSRLKEALQLGFVSLTALVGPALQVLPSEIRVLSLAFAD